MRQLIVHDDDEVAEATARGLRKLLEDADPKIVGNLMAGWKELRSKGDGYSVVVVGTQIRHTPRSSGAQTQLAAVQEFVKKVKKAYPHLPLIVLSKTKDPKLTGFLMAFEHTALIVFRADFRDELSAEVQRLLLGAPPPKKRMELEIRLTNEISGGWMIHYDGSRESWGILNFKRKTLRELEAMTQKLEAEVATRGAIQTLDQVSNLVNTLLFRDSAENHAFHQELEKHRENIGGASNMRVVVKLAKTMQSVLLDAMRSLQPDDDDYWMLKAPIVRHYDSSAGRCPLFLGGEETEANNCLIVAAYPEGGVIPAGNWKGDIAALKKLSLEAEEVYKKLKPYEYKTGSGIGKVDILQIDPKRRDPIKELTDKLREMPWHLVHFAGHGIKGKNGWAGLVLAPSGNSVMPLSSFALCLPEARFLFVSSCESASPVFLQQAVRYNLPAVLGYRWKVGDEVALKCAVAFYEALFDRAEGSDSYRSLEYSFLRARQKARECCPDVPAWASPLLIAKMQSAVSFSPSKGMH